MFYIYVLDQIEQFLSAFTNIKISDICLRRLDQHFLFSMEIHCLLVNEISGLIASNS